MRVSVVRISATIIAMVGREPLREAIRRLREHTRPVDEGHRERLLAATEPCAGSCRCCSTRSSPGHRRRRAGPRCAQGAQADRAQAHARARRRRDADRLALLAAAGGARARQSQPACAHVLRARGAARQPSPPRCVRTPLEPLAGDGSHISPVAGRRHPRRLPRRIAEPRPSPTVWPPSLRHSYARRFKRARVSDRT